MPSKMASWGCSRFRSLTKVGLVCFFVPTAFVELARFYRLSRETDGPWTSSQRAASLATLVSPAIDDGLESRSPPDVQGPNSLGAVDFMCAETGEVEPGTHDVPPNTAHRLGYVRVKKGCLVWQFLPDRRFRLVLASVQSFGRGRMLPLCRIIV